MHTVLASAGAMIGWETSPTCKTWTVSVLPSCETVHVVCRTGQGATSLRVNASLASVASWASMSCLQMDPVAVMYRPLDAKKPHVEGAACGCVCGGAPIVPMEQAATAVDSAATARDTIMRGAFIAELLRTAAQCLARLGNTTLVNGVIRASVGESSDIGLDRRREPQASSSGELSCGSLPSHADIREWADSPIDHHCKHSRALCGVPGAAAQGG